MISARRDLALLDQLIEVATFCSREHRFKPANGVGIATASEPPLDLLSNGLRGSVLRALRWKPEIENVPPDGDCPDI
jgi:hypothetical protein